MLDVWTSIAKPQAHGPRFRAPDFVAVAHDRAECAAANAEQQHALWPLATVIVGVFSAGPRFDRTKNFRRLSAGFWPGSVTPSEVN
jgi:hypothetical protein